jgi:protein SCO1/2
MAFKEQLGRRQALLAAGGLGLAALAGLAWRAGRSKPGVAASGAPASAEAEAARAAAARAHYPFGPVEPRLAPPSLSLLGADGKELDLPVWLKGRPTAVQLVFTRCTTTCPIQGALFAALAPKLERGARILSVSIDPEHDTPAELSAWMARFGSHPAWYAAAPRDLAGVDVMFDFLRGRAQGLDRHSVQVYLFDTQGQLAYRTADMPSPAEVVSVLGKLA